LYRLFFGTDVSLRVFEDIYLSWNSTVPSLTLLHAVWSDNLQALAIDNTQKYRLIHKEAEALNQISHPIITVSEPYLRYLKSDHFSEFKTPQIHVVPLGLKLAAFDQDNESNRISKSIVYCGTLEPRKNVFFLLKVFDKLYRTDTDYKLTIIGEGPERQKLQAVALERKIPVRFLGRLNHADVINELLRHEIYLHTSVKESFSFSLLEAKLSGLTTCAYQGIEVPDEFIDIAMNSFDVDEWCRKIIANDVVGKVFDAGRYSSENMAEATLALVQSTSRD
jgi:glycosyltransferase involved in cell wall biosynthesis